MYSVYSAVASAGWLLSLKEETREKGYLTECTLEYNYLVLYKDGNGSNEGAKPWGGRIECSWRIPDIKPFT